MTDSIEWISGRASECVYVCKQIIVVTFVNWVLWEEICKVLQRFVYISIHTHKRYICICINVYMFIYLRVNIERKKYINTKYKNFTNILDFLMLFCLWLYICFYLFIYMYMYIKKCLFVVLFDIERKNNENRNKFIICVCSIVFVGCFSYFFFVISFLCFIFLSKLLISISVYLFVSVFFVVFLYYLSFWHHFSLKI